MILDALTINDKIEKYTTMPSLFWLLTFVTTHFTDLCELAGLLIVDIYFFF